MFTLEIKTGNAAFTDPYSGEYDQYAEGAEINRILRNIIGKIEDGCTYGTVFDINGNRVGRWQR